MNTDHLLVEFDKFPVLFAPGIGSSVVGIGKSAKARFVSVINRGGSGPGHLHYDGFPEYRFVDVFLGGFRTERMHSSDLSVGSG